MKKKVSFDFDDCLDNLIVQEYCEELIERGLEVWVCTARMDNVFGNPNWNDDIFFTCQRLGIPITRIIMTNGSNKSHFLKDKDFIWLLDDMEFNVKDVTKHSDCIGIRYTPWNMEWRDKCELLIKNKNK
jgi:hypothetical protein